MRSSTSIAQNARHLMYGIVVAAFVLLCPLLATGFGCGFAAAAATVERPVGTQQDEFNNIHGRASALRPLGSQTLSARSGRASDLASLDHDPGGALANLPDGAPGFDGSREVPYSYVPVVCDLCLHAQHRIRTPPLLLDDDGNIVGFRRTSQKTAPRHCGQPALRPAEGALWRTSSGKIQGTREA